MSEANSRTRWALSPWFNNWKHEPSGAVSDGVNMPVTEGSAPGVLNVPTTETDMITSFYDLYSKLKYETSVKSGRTVTIRPVSEIHSSNVYTFQILPQSNDYINLQQSRLHVVGKLVKADGTDLTVTESKKIVPVNNLMASLFESISVSLNGQSFHSLQDTSVGLKSHVEGMLSYSIPTGNNQLRSAGWAPDIHGEQGGLFTNANVLKDATGTGEYANANWRQSLIAKSRQFELCGPIPLDVCSIERAFPPSTKMDLTFNRILDHRYAFITNDLDLAKCKWQISDIYLTVRFSTMSPAMLSHHESLWSQGRSMILPCKKSIVRRTTFAPNTKRLFVHNAVAGTLPKSSLFFLCLDNAATGDATLDPYHLQSRHLKHFSVTFNGVRYPGGDGLIMDFETKNYEKAYRSLFDNTGFGQLNLTNHVTPEAFQNGFTCFAVDYSNDLSGGFYLREAQEGTMDVLIELKENLTKAVSLIHIDIYDLTIEVSRDMITVHDDI